MNRVLAKLLFPSVLLCLIAQPAWGSNVVVSFSDEPIVISRVVSCKNQAVSLNIQDPNQEILAIEVELQDYLGQRIERDLVFIDRDLNINFASFYLCPSDFETTGTGKVVATVTWYGSGKQPLVVEAPALISDYSEEAVKLISTLKEFCIKGSTYKAKSGTKCPSGYKPIVFKTPSVTQWNSLSRSPAKSAKGNFVVFTCIAQFDSVTGESKFRGYASRLERPSYFGATNSFFKGDAKQLLAFSEDDLIVANVTVLGAHTYTQIGGRNTVPYFQIRDLRKLGTC